MKCLKQLTGILGVFAIVVIISSAAYAAETLQECNGTWILDEEPQSTLVISEMASGRLSVDAAFYRMFRLEGHATVSGDGKMAIFQGDTDTMGILSCEGNSLVFRVIEPPEAVGSTSYEFFMDHPFIYHRDDGSQNTVDSVPPAVTNTAFYGIWCAADKTYDGVQETLYPLQQAGFTAEILVTTDWSNLNPEPWYVVTAGRYETEESANAVLSAVKQVYPDAYVKWSGNYNG